VIGSGHEWAEHPREQWTVCTRCGMVRNYGGQSSCRGGLPDIRLRREAHRPLAVGDVIDDGVVGMVAWVGEELVRVVWSSEAVTLERHDHAMAAREKWEAR
jgi:hypothetical protein